MMKTGWFGRPDGRNGSRTHIVNGKHRPICGARFARSMIFQVCINGISEKDTECANCRGVVRRLFQAAEKQS